MSKEIPPGFWLSKSGKVAGPIIKTFTIEERIALFEDGAVIYLPEIPQRETVRALPEAEISLWPFTDDGDRSFALRARILEVAIYPDPERFFVPDSFKKHAVKQEKLVQKDAENLRKRLGLEGITEVLPQDSEVREVFSKHNVTGVRLLGENYIRTVNLTYRSRSSFDVANVDSWVEEFGVYGYGDVHGLGVRRRYPHPQVGAARWIVPQRARIFKF